MRSRRWRSIQSGLPESAYGSPKLVKHALFVEVDGMSRNKLISEYAPLQTSAKPSRPVPRQPQVYLGSESRASVWRVGPLPNGRVCGRVVRVPRCTAA